MLAVLLAVLLPAAAAIGYAITHASQQSLAMAVEGVHVLAAQTADRLVNVLQDRKVALARLTERPRVRALDPQHCDPIIAEYVDLHPEYNTLGVRDRDGNIVCSFVPNPPQAGEVVASPWFQRAIRSDGFAASDAHLGQPSGQWVTVLTHPIRDDAGRTSGIGVLALNLLRLQARVLHAVPQGAVVSVIDGGNRFLLRSIDPQEWIGKDAGDPELTRRALSEGPGTLQAQGIDGIARVNVYRTVPGTGWLVIAGVPEETVYAGHRQRLRNAIALGSAALLLAFGLAWAIARRIVLPLRELERVARAAGEGDLTAHARAGGSRELATVATQFNQMLDARARAETELRFANQRYALAAMTGDVWDWNIATSAITPQPEFWRRLGYQDSEARDQVAFFESTIHPEDLARWRQALKDHLGRHSPYDLKLRIRAKSGEYRTFHTRGMATWDDRGRATYMAGTTFDITERERAEAERREAGERFEKIFLGAPEAMSLSDLETGRFLQVNEVFCEMFGYARDAVIGHTSLELKLWTDTRGRDEIVAQLRAGQRVIGFEGRARRRTGEIFDVRLSADRMELGGQPQLLLMFSDISGRKAAEQALHESEERFRSLTELSSDFYWEQDERFRFVTRIHSGSEKRAFPDSEVIGRTRWELPALNLTGADWAKHRVILEAHQEFRDFEIARPLPSGEPRWISVSGRPIFDRDGRFRGYRGVGIDITVRKQAQASLRDRDQRLRLAQDHGHVGVWDWTPATGEENFSDEMNRIYGLAPGSIRTYRDWLGRVHPEDVGRMESERDAALAQRRMFDLEFRVFHSTGELRWIAARGGANYDEAGGITRVLGINLDITERKRIENAVRESAGRLGFVVDGTETGLWDWDLTSNRVQYSRMWKRLLGYEEHEVADHLDEWRRLIHPDDFEPTLAKVNAFLRQSVGAFEVEFRMRHKSGEYRWIFSRATVRFGVDGKPTHLLGLHTDITARKKAEDALRETNERLRMLSARLLEVQEAERAAIARELHDEIGQSLTALKLGTQALARRLLGAEAASLAGLVSIADRTLAQTRSLSLDLRPPQLDQLGLAATLRDALQRIADAAGIEARLVTEPEDFALERGVATTAFRVAQEAITNAVRHAAARHLVVELRATRDALELAVSDDGAGFDLEAARGRAVAGASMGLIGIEERVALAGGELKIVTRPGQGTRVQARFPLPPPRR